jgi:molybdopterin converting factor subunit 1
MHVKVLFFGMLKDLVGRSEDRLEVGEGARLAAIFDHYAQRHPQLQEMASSIVLARNQEFSSPEAAVFEGDEVAFLPPVSGGSGAATSAAEHEDELGNYFAVVRAPIDSRALAARLQRGSDGAIVTFEGVTRDHSGARSTRYLEYECYVPLALKKMREIGADLLSSYPISRIGMSHRIGRLEIGEASVVIVVTSEHRGPAYEASRQAIDRLKRLVPIWKKEYFTDGAVWVEGQWDEAAPRLEGSPRCSG